jgi:hypothetical protein
MQVVLAVAFAFAAACGGTELPKIVSKSMPEGGSFTGVWHSPQYGEMHLRQNGSAVIGRFTKDERNGRIQGNVQGDLMRFEWTEKRELIAGRSVTTKGHGYFRIVNDEADKAWKLIGEWGHDADERGGGPWNAIKSPKAKVMLDSAGHATDGSDDESSGSDSSSDEGEDDFSGKDTSGGELDNL